MSLSLLESISANTDGEESQNKNEHEFQSFAWQNIDMDENKPALRRVIEEIRNSAEDLPQIIKAAKDVSEISSGIKWLQNHKEDFERISCRASILIIVLWESCKKSKHHSPTLQLRRIVNYHIDTVRRIDNLMKRNFNFAKRIFGFYFIRNFKKFRKYEQRLDSVAEYLENLGIKIDEVLQEVFDDQVQHDDDAELPKEPDRGDSIVKERRADNQELFAEGSSCLRKQNAPAKHTNRRMKSEEENRVDHLYEVLLEVLDSQTQQHDDAELSEKPDKGDSLQVDKESRQRTADIQELFVEGHNRQRKANAVAKPTIRKMKSEEDVVDRLNEVLQEVPDSQRLHHNDPRLSVKPATGDSLKKKNMQRTTDIHETFVDGNNSQRKADAAAKPTNLRMISEAKNEANDLNEVLHWQEVPGSQLQHHYNAELSEKPASGHSFGNTQRTADIQELSIDGSNGQRKANTVATNRNQEKKSEKENIVDHLHELLLEVLDNQAQHHDEAELSEEMKSEEENMVDHLCELLLQVHDSQAQHPDEAELSEKPPGGDSLHTEILQRRADIQEHFNNQYKADAAAKPTNRKTKSEEENLADHLYELLLEALDSQEQHHDDAKLSEKPVNTDNEEVPVRVSATTMGPTKEKKPAMTPRQNRDVRRHTAPVHPVSTSGVSVPGHNHGPSNVYNSDVGNTKDSTVWNVGNDNSENYFQPMLKPTKSAATTRQNVRVETGPSRWHSVASVDPVLLYPPPWLGDCRQ